jgi:hypothetical protein
MALKTVKIFLASSAELKEDRNEFRNFISEVNATLHAQGIYLEIVQWESFLDAISDTRLQDEYNKAICACDIVLCLFFTKVGKYTAEEFDTAYQVFRDTGKPKIWTYFKDAPVNAGSITDEILTLLQFKKKIGELGHFHSVYTNIDNLKYQFRNQLDKFLPQFTGQGEGYDDLPETEEDPAGYVFNESLTRHVMEAIQVYSPKVKRFLDNASGMEANWETQTRFSDPAKEIIAFSFVGVLGIQLRKLMAIGKEEMSENKRRKYLAVSQLTGKRALQILCFALLSGLWDCKKERSYTLSADQQSVLQNFFDNAFEQDIDYFVNLLIHLMDVYRDNSLVFPIPEVAELAIHLQPGSEFLKSCSQLSALSHLPDKTFYPISRCREAEQHLTVVFQVLGFLINYKMVSIKSIGYFETRNTKPYYLYSYTALGIDVKSNVDQERVNQAVVPTTTDSVLLYKGSYKQSINLYPFIIDVNALAFEGGAKICFYACRNNMDDSLNYSFLEDNSRVKIADTGTLKAGTDISEIWMDPEKRKNLRFDIVFAQFQAAKAAVAGLDVPEDDNFQNPF